MLEKLGIRKVAYDWRAEHIPTFDAELEAYARHGIVLHAFWMPVDTATPLTENHWPIVLDLVERHHVTPELWVMLNNQLVDASARREACRAALQRYLAPVARAAAKRNCRIGFYNHGGWWGEPDNQIRVLQGSSLDGLRECRSGLQLSSRACARSELFRAGTPHAALFVDGEHQRHARWRPANSPVGEGSHEAAMLRDLVAAGYRGPIGILHHRDGVDAEIGLKENLHGIEQLLSTP